MVLGVSDTNLFAGTRGSGVWKRPISEMNTSDATDFASNETVCQGEIIPALIATGDNVRLPTGYKSFVILKFDKIGI